MLDLPGLLGEEDVRGENWGVGWWCRVGRAAIFFSFSKGRQSDV